MTDTDQWYSDDALRKQAELDARIARGETVPLDVWCGLLAPRVQPTEAEQCANCEGDARDQVGGEEICGKRWCSLCVSRGRHTEHAVTAYRALEAENARLREGLDLLRPAHHTPYADEEHQGGNCADIMLALVTQALKAEQVARRVREWCDKTMAAASGGQSEPVFQARMQLIDEVRALLPEVAS